MSELSSPLKQENLKMYLQIGNTSWRLSLDDYKALRGMRPETVKSRLITDVIDLRLNRLKGDTI